MRRHQGKNLWRWTLGAALAALAVGGCASTSEERANGTPAGEAPTASSDDGTASGAVGQDTGTSTPNPSSPNWPDAAVSAPSAPPAPGGVTGDQGPTGPGAPATSGTGATAGVGASGGVNGTGTGPGATAGAGAGVTGPRAGSGEAAPGASPSGQLGGGSAYGGADVTPPVHPRQEPLPGAAGASGSAGVGAGTSGSATGGTAAGAGAYGTGTSAVDNGVRPSSEDAATQARHQLLFGSGDRYQISGRLAAVNSDRGEVTIQRPNLPPALLKLEPQTRIQVNGRQGTVTDLQPGSDVRASFNLSGRAPIALDVTETR